MRARIERCGTPLLIAAGSMPIPLLVGWANDLPQLALLPLVYLLSACLCVQLKGKWRLPVGLVLGAGMAAACVVWFVQAMQPVILALGAVYVILLLVSLPARENLAHAAVVAGISVQALSQIYLNLMVEDLRETLYAGAMPLLTIDLIIFLAAALFSLNGLSLRSAMPEGKGVPAAIRRRNRALTWLMLGAALLIALIPALGQLLNQAWEVIRLAVGTVIGWLMALRFGQETGGGQPGAEQMDLSALGEAAAPSAFAVWMERILLIVTAVAAVVLLIWAARKLWKKLMQLLKWLFQHLQSYAASATEDYVDEVQDTRTQGEERFSLAGRRRRRLSARELAALPPRERVRARYGLTRMKHPEWTDSTTARENLDQTSAGIYERARYSAHEITEQDAEKFMK